MTIVFVSFIVLLCVRSRCVCVFTIILFLCWSLGHCVCGENQMIASSLKLSFLGCQSNVWISYFGITNHLGFFFILCFSPCFYSLTLNLICLKILVKFQVLNLFFSSLFEAVCMCVPCVCYYLLPHFAFDVYIDQMKIDRLIPKVMICFI